MNKRDQGSILLKIILLILSFFLLIAGCNLPESSSQGLMTWIDQPLDETHFELEPIKLQAHASDPDGIAQIEFVINDSVVASVPTEGKTLEDASVQWTPVENGTYTLLVRASDSLGNTNAQNPAMITIIVGNIELSGNSSAVPLPAGSTPDELSTPTFTPTAAFTLTTTITPTSDSTPKFVLESDANCRLGPSTSFAYVEGLKEGITVIIEGRNVDNSWLWIKSPSNSGHCWVSASTGKTSGNWQVVKVVATPALPPTVTETYYIYDQEPPEISNISIDPNMISAVQQCGDTPATFVIQAKVMDDGGISSVVVRVSGYGEYTMASIDGGYYRATVGPFDSPGTLNVVVQATDNASNTNLSSSSEVQVISCPD